MLPEKGFLSVPARGCKYRGGEERGRTWEVSISNKKRSGKKLRSLLTGQKRGRKLIISSGGKGGGKRCYPFPQEKGGRWGEGRTVL